MLAQLSLSQTPAATLNTRHLLVICPKSKKLPGDLPHPDLLKSVLARRDMKIEALAKSPVAANTATGAQIVWAMLDFEKDTFAQQVQVRKALQLLLEEHPASISIAVLGDDTQRQHLAE